MENTLVFIHGLESTAQGAKGQFFSQIFPQMIIEDYTGDFATRMRKLNGLLAGKTDLIHCRIELWRIDGGSIRHGK